ncbi:MAG: glycosyltransferase family 4 protein [Anaerolineae bacterium]|nr:glycosyltransferase family 4 protein [Anaerolineae bacterium]
MTKRIAILHYASPPGIGGVESMIEHQARGLKKLGYAIRIISGKGAPFDPEIDVHINPLFGSTHPDVLAVKAEIDAGKTSHVFEALVERQMAALREALADCDVCIAHNVLSLNKNLPLTAALARLMQTQPVKLIAWNSDLAWTNPQYQPELHPGYPWELLRQRWANVQYVTISEPRQEEMAALYGVDPLSIHVITPGIDPARFFRWTQETTAVIQDLRLLDADGLLLLPARLTRRKNVALALRILAAIRAQSGCDYRLIVSGPPGPHNPSNASYLTELLDLRRTLGLEGSAHFLYEWGTDGGPFLPDDDMVAGLYQIADALFFPSIQEGFGIPILEAGLAGVPIFCADIPPLRATGADDVTYFDPVDELPEHIAARVLNGLETNPTTRLRRRVRRAFRWDALIYDQLVPLLED